MNPEELPKTGEPQASAEESAPEKTISTPAFGEPEQSSPPVAPRSSATQWAIGLVVLALVGYPLVRWAMNRGGSPAAPAAASAALSPNAQAMLNQSFSLYQAGKYREAVAVGMALVKENPNAADAWNNLSASYAKLGQWDDAIQSAQQALRIAPNHQLARGNLAYAQKVKANGAPPPDQGGPGTLQYFLNLSADDYRTGKFPECIEAAGKAIGLDPKSSTAFNNRGSCYASLGMFDEAIQSEEEGVRLDPGNQLAKNNLAYAVQQKKVRDSLREKK